MALKKSFLDSNDKKEILANIAEQRNFGQDAENLLLSMVYKVEDSYNNYQNVKREVPDKNEFIEDIVNDVNTSCAQILIATPKSQLEKELKANKCKILTEVENNVIGKRVISYPNERTLLYGVSKAAIPPLKSNSPIASKALATAISIGKCISKAEVIRDFSGWSWSIDEKEIESTECNIIYVFLTYLLGYDFVNLATVEKIRNSVSKEFFEELIKVSVQFFLSYYKNVNEKIIKKLASDKKKLEQMKHQATYVMQISDIKRTKVKEIKKIDNLLSDQRSLKNQYVIYNSKLPDDKKIFSVSHYAEMLEKRRNSLLKQIAEYNKLLNPDQFLKVKEDLRYEIKLYEGKTDIAKLEREFEKLYEDKVKKTNNSKAILNLLYQVRYLNFLPNCSLKLKKIEQILIPKAINAGIIAPVSNNDEIDYRILKGIFDSQTLALENLYIKLASQDNMIHVEIYDNDILETQYNVILPEGSEIEIRKSRRTKIFEK